MSTPHQMVDGLVNSVVGGVQGVGGQLVGAVDGALRTVGAPTPGPEQVVSRVVNGLFSGVRAVGGGVISALNVPTEALGIPPAGGPGDIRPPGGLGPKLPPFMRGG